MALAAHLVVKRIVLPDEAGEPAFAYARAGLLMLLFAAPLAFGAVQPWAWGTLVCGIAFVVLVWAWGCLRLRSARLIFSPLYIPALALLGFAAAQLILRRSLDPIATREALLKLTAYILLFLVTQHLYGTALRRSWQWMASATAIYAGALSLFAIVQFLTTPTLIYGVIEPRFGGWVFGPYVNHSNYAGLLEMLIPVIAGFAFSLRPRHQARPLLGFALVISIVSVFLSGARGGLIVLALETLLFAAIVARSPADSLSRRRGLGAMLLLAMLAAAAFFWLDPGSLWQRWQQTLARPDIALGERNAIAADTLRMARAHLAWGVGLGAFATPYPLYQTVPTELVIDYAHNDYLQFFAEAGVPACVLVPVALAMFLWLAFRRLRQRLRRSEGWLQATAAVGVCGLLLHSVSEFNLHIPANAAWFTFLAALATIPSRSLAGAGPPKATS